MGRLTRLLTRPSARHEALEGFVDSLLQTFENSRPGLTAEMLQKGDVEAFFRELYEKEVRPLRDKISRLRHLSPEEQEELFQRVDERIRRVVLPAYARIASAFTPRERNDFYLLAEPLHGIERLGWAIAGVVLGALVVAAPFIPLWSKEWVLVFGIGGFVFPSLRRYFALRRYQGELNDLVARTDDEIWRLDLGYLASAWERGAQGRSQRSADGGAEAGGAAREDEPSGGAPAPRARREER